jgi:hypothetical protein
MVKNRTPVTHTQSKIAVSLYFIYEAIKALDSKSKVGDK